MSQTSDTKIALNDCVDYALRFAIADDYGVIDRPANTSIAQFNLSALLDHLSAEQQHDIYAILDGDGFICGNTDPQAIAAILSALSALHSDFVAPTFEHDEHLEILICTR